MICVKISDTLLLSIVMQKLQVIILHKKDQGLVHCRVKSRFPSCVVCCAQLNFVTMAAIVYISHQGCQDFVCHFNSNTKIALRGHFDICNILNDHKIIINLLELIHIRNPLFFQLSPF